MNEQIKPGRGSALSGVDLRPKRDPPGSRDGEASAEELAQGAAPREPIFVCQGCGAVGQESGKPLDSECHCKEPEPTKHAADCLLNFKGATPKPKHCTCKSSFEELAMPSEVSVIDPDTGYPNEYAKRVKARNLADTAYLVLQERQGHAVAATTVCRHFGHDPSSGFCMRCGARVGYDFE